MVKVSVIIPVYNGECYLRQCLDSVCGQTLKEIEIICVDDGSADSSPEILAEYAAKDGRVRVFTQQNLYAGAARNLGKRHAAGEYLAFWDCDDFFEPDALETLYARAVEMRADICVCGGYRYLEEKGKSYPFGGYLNVGRTADLEVFNRETNGSYILNFTNDAPWNKLFRREFVEQNALDFQTIRNGNDIFFTNTALCLAERVTYVDRKLVHYRMLQENGLVSSLSKSPVSPIDAWMDTADYLEKRHIFPKQSFVNKALGAMAYLLRNIRQYGAFVEAFAYLKGKGLAKLHLELHGEDYYYSGWQYGMLKHLWEDEADDFLLYLMHENYYQIVEKNLNYELKNEKLGETKEQLRNVKQELKDTRQELKQRKSEAARLTKRLQEVEASWSYRVGKALMFVPGKIKRVFQKNG